MKNDLVIVNQSTIEDKIYMIRGQKVMLDFDLAKIYGYTTMAFNQQVKRNIDKFDEDFMFQLTKEEVEYLSLSQNVIAMQTKGVKGGRTTLPYAFTEQGIYMLMTVLRGELATQQSKALIRIFKGMKDYIIETKQFASKQELLQLSLQVNENTKAIRNLATKDDIAMIMENFIEPQKFKEYFIVNGELVEANLAYQEIYNLARKTIYIIDEYIDIKTLILLKNITSNISIIIFSDNQNKYLHRKEYEDFMKEYSPTNITFQTLNHICHDRYIILDYDTKYECIYHCGASSKDAGKKITTISLIQYKEIYHDFINQLLNNPKLNF